MLRFTLLCCAVLFGQVAPPVAPPAGGDNAALAERFYQAARAAKSPAEAMTAVKQALGCDSNHLPANLKLAELLVEAGQLGPATEQVDKCKALVGAGAAAEARTQLAAVEQKLAGLREKAAKWTDLRTRYAAKYVALGEQPGAAGMASTLLAFQRAAALAPDDKQIATQCQGAADAQPKLPVPAESPNRDGARVLVSQAAKLSAAGKLAEAADSLKSAVSLDPAPPGPWFDLAVCAQRQKDMPLAAACLAAARQRLAAETGPDADRLAGRIKSLMPAVDPRLDKLEQLDKEFAAAACKLAQTISPGGDKGLAVEIDAFVKSLAGESTDNAPASLVKPLPGNIAPKIDLTAPAVRVEVLDAAVKRLRNCVLIKPMPGSTSYLATATFTLGGLTFADDSRIRWRYEPTGDPQKRAKVMLACWPFRPETVYGHASLQEQTGAKAFNLYDAERILEAYRRNTAYPVTNKAPFRADGIYEFCFEKVGDKVSAWVGSTRMLEVQLTAAQMKMASRKPIQLLICLSHGGSVDPGGKATLLELTQGKDLPPFRPPTSQPDNK